MSGRTAFVVVKKSWLNTDGICDIINHGRKSEASGETHLIIAPLGDDTDHRGL
jgi:hypothetical protein